MVQAFTGAPVDMEVEKGGRFSLMSGNVTGEFVDLVGFSLWFVMLQWSCWKSYGRFFLLVCLVTTFLLEIVWFSYVPYI